MCAVSQDGAKIWAFFVGVDGGVQIVDGFVNEGVLHVHDLAGQRDYETNEREVVPSADTGAQPDAVVVEANDAGLTIIAVAAPRRRAKDVAAVAISHLLENCLSRILEHIKHLFAVYV